MHSGNYNSYAPTLTGTGASGTWGISITGSAGSANTAPKLNHADGPRNLSDRLPNWNTRSVTFDFVGSASANGAGNYAGVMTFAPWDGTSASTGDSSYQLSFANDSGVNASGMPKLSIRNGINTTWNAWYTLLHSGNVSSYAVTSISATSPIVASASTGAITLSHANSGVTAGTYNNVTVNNKGHVTAGSNAAYLTAEADTLATVTGRGATTTTPITLQRIFWNTDGGNSNNTFAANHYSIGQAAGAWTHPYPDLIIGHHTGIRIGAHYNYGGTRFYNNSPWGGDTGGGETELMSIGNGDDHVRIAQIGYAGNSFRAPIFYDSNDTSYYVDPASTSDTAQRMRGGTVYGPNVTWGAYLLVGGDGRQNYTNTAYASVCTTNGNLHLDSGTAAATHINWYDGTDLLVGAGDSGTLRFKVYGVDNYSYATGSMRAPLFYDSDNTAYYLDAAGNSEFNRINTVRTNNFLYMDNNYGHSVVGVYSASRYQGVFAMGDSYKLPADGTTTGSLYGLAWSHPNAGGVAANLNTHGLLAMENGTWLASLCGSTRARDDMRAPIFYDNNNTAFYLDPNATGTSLNVAGSITAGGNITASSDIRLKEDIEVITDAINKVKQITGVTYTRKENNKRQTGVIAQDVLKVLPEAVEGSEDSMYSVAYGNMVGLLIEAIKDQQTIIDSQESRIAKLEILVAQLIEG